MIDREIAAPTKFVNRISLLPKRAIQVAPPKKTIKIASATAVNR